MVLQVHVDADTFVLFKFMNYFSFCPSFYFVNPGSSRFDSGRLDTGVEKMAASAATASCSPGLSPNYAVICSFLERYGALLDLPELTFPQLERCLQDTAAGSELRLPHTSPPLVR